MSTEVITVTTRQEYVAEWRINKISCIKTEGVRTPDFFPIPNIDVKFCFEMRYQRNLSFKLVLVKLSASEIPPSLKVEFDVTVKCTYCTFLKEYKSLSGLSVDKMNSVTCIDEKDSSQFCMHASNRYSPYNGYNGKCVQSDTITLKLWMKIFGLSTPSVCCSQMRSLNNLKRFTEDFSALWKLNALSDVTIRIEGKNFHAHKAVLAAHSAVFMKMMESNFLESKTNEIIISDFKYDIFECFLKYLYSGKIEDKSWSNIKELYILADKYDVQALKREGIEIIRSFLTVDQVCEILILAYEYNDNDLKQDAKRFAVSHFQEIVRKAEWYELVISHPIIVRDVMASVYCAPENILKN